MDASTAAKAVGFCESLSDSTAYPLLNPVCEVRTEIENIGRLRGLILRLARYYYKQRLAGRSWFSEKRFDSRGTQAAKPDRLQHFPEQFGHFPPQRPTRMRATFRGQQLPECHWRCARARGSRSIPISCMSVRFAPALREPSALRRRLFRCQRHATCIPLFQQLLTQ